MIIQIRNWEKYNPRRDYKRPWWFGFNNNFFTDPDFYDFTDKERLFWIYLLCESSRYNKNGISPLIVDHCHRTINCTEKEQKLAIKKLLKIKAIYIRSDRGTYEIRTESVPHITLQNITEQEKNISAVALPRLALLWNIHSKKFPKVKACGAQRKKHAEARWRENPSEEYWADVIARLNSSEFCNGKNERGWIADFDFLIKPETANKTLEGKYSSVGKPEELSYMAKKIKGIT